jgi:ribosomal protein S18 acetylase RimI-like enzyme
MPVRNPSRELRLRPYRHSDLRFYRRCLERLQDHLVALDPFGVVRRGPGYGPRYARSALASLRSREGTLLVAELSGQPVGFVAAFVRPPDPIRDLELRPRRQGYIMDLFVVPEARGRGVGTALLRAAERALNRAGCRHVWLNVFAPNRAALALYRSLGYEEFGLTLMARTGGGRSRTAGRRRKPTPRSVAPQASRSTPG